MKCVICYGNEIEIMEVKEEIADDDNIIYISIKIPVCKTCGERYYDRKTVRFLEEIKDKLDKEELELKEIGKVLIYN
ncbi:MAG: YgiT-type zinc finger protein [Candidatus Poribacteria bacterium]